MISLNHRDNNSSLTSIGNSNTHFSREIRLNRGVVTCFFWITLVAGLRYWKNIHLARDIVSNTSADNTKVMLPDSYAATLKDNKGRCIPKAINIDLICAPMGLQHVNGNMKFWGKKFPPTVPWA
nr:hypothetical protein Itr_chr05CG17080 [Ipomoea trifida]